MDRAKLTEYCKLVVDCFNHNGWYGENNRFFSETRANIRDHAVQVLDYFDCPKDWTDIVLLCTEAADYYGYEHAVFGGED